MPRNIAQTRFSFTRLWGLVRKEFIQLKRDRLTFAMLIGVPILQLVLFGFAINTDPKSLPTAVLQKEISPFTRTAMASLQNTGYFRFTHRIQSRAEADQLLKTGEVIFVLTIPENFSRRLVRGEGASILLEVDATDPIVASNAIFAAEQAIRQGFEHDFKGPLAYLAAAPPAFSLDVHRRYNPESITQYNTVPGIIGVILTLTLVIITGISLSRERETGTLENLFAMPLLPIEVMLGKIIPFIIGAAVQVAIVLAAARFIFDVPILGSLWILSIGVVIYIAANLSVGFTFSTIAKTQLQAVQMSIFFFLPSILLSGFMFPFDGMPGWAQTIGHGLPLTYFLRIVRGVMLKEAGLAEIWPHIWPLMIILMVVMTVALRRYKATLD
jgi:ABC-2 type transport system permease protein